MGATTELVGRTPPPKSTDYCPRNRSCDTAEWSPNYSEPGAKPSPGGCTGSRCSTTGRE